jgi:hypothetical protein
MATLATPPLAQPINRLFIGLLSPPNKQLSRSAQAQATPKPLRDHPEEPASKAVLASLVMGALAPFVIALWPLVFVVLVLVFAVLTPFVAFGAGVKAILHHVNGAPAEHHS